MKKLALVSAVFLILFESCSDCKDVLLGRVDLMPNSINLLKTLQGKSLIFKDSLGSILIFSSNRDLLEEKITVPSKFLCRKMFGSGTEYFDSKSNSLDIKSKELDLTMRLTIMVKNTVVDSVLLDTLLYDVLEYELGRNNKTHIIFEAEISKRATNKPDRKTFPKPISELTLLGKSFKNVIVKNNDLKVKNIEPLELYFNTNQGVVAMRLLDGRLFVLDKIE
jgi:hypothetical protein